jgi:hypothetical protein
MCHIYMKQQFFEIFRCIELRITIFNSVITGNSRIFSSHSTVKFVRVCYCCSQTFQVFTFLNEGCELDACKYEVIDLCFMLASSFQTRFPVANMILSILYMIIPPLWSSGQSSWLLTQRSRVRFLALPDFFE